LPYDTQALENWVEVRERDASDKRTAFQHDRDRILYASSFRRLAGKSQVVSVSEFGLYHTRLTHTLKVAQLGRRLAERLRDRYREQNPKLEVEIWPPDPDLVEAACLAHDLGHAPFGHVGEEALAKRFDEIARGPNAKHTTLAVKAIGGFEGNAQTLRILMYLAAREPIDPRCGLNLTRATLDATVKYPNYRVQDKKAFSKWGAIELDRARMEWVRSDHGIYKEAPRCFEADLMDWCDDVTYAVHDLIDFYRGGAIPLHELLGGRGARRKGSLPTLVTDFLRDAKNDSDMDEYSLTDMEEAWRKLIDLTQGVIDEPWDPTIQKRAALQTVTSILITHFVDQVGWEAGGAPCRYDGKFVIDPDEDSVKEKELACRLLKKVLWKRVIERHPLASQQHGQAQIVSGLLDIYHGDERVLPPDRHEELLDHKDPLRVATDHVASLTEDEAQALYRRLTGVHLGAITDAIT
jgi:dGTPase